MTEMTKALDYLGQFDDESCEAERVGYTEWYDETGLREGTFKRCPERLIKLGLVEKDGAVYRATEPQEDHVGSASKVTFD